MKGSLCPQGRSFVMLYEATLQMYINLYYPCKLSTMHFNLLVEIIFIISLHSTCPPSTQPPNNAAKPPTNLTSSPLCATGQCNQWATLFFSSLHLFCFVFTNPTNFLGEALSDSFYRDGHTKFL